MPVEREAVMAALGRVKDPELFKDIVTLNMVKGVRIEGDDVSVHIELTTPACPMKDVIQRDVERAVRDAGARSVHIDWSANTRGQQPAGQAPRNGVLPQVKNVIAVGAGKGGVGKSTVAANLAVGLARFGATVGLMDGDIYGPSMPTMLGVKGVAPNVRGNRILPHHVHGIHAITIGSLVEQEKPLIWRGPMAHGAFKQLLLDNTEWPELDYLVVDLPPGTGDVPLTLCQLLPITGAVVVATPQQVALDDAVRAVRMFQQLGAPILGLVENMSYFVGPDGAEHDIFGRGGTERAAQRLHLPYLGAIPMFTELRVNSDAGNPTANFEGNPRLRESLERLVQTVAGEVSKRNMAPAGPELTIS
jgi:ATP-binding protein involved in chromosome partitioning